MSITEQQEDHKKYTPVKEFCSALPVGGSCLQQRSSGYPPSLRGSTSCPTHLLDTGQATYSPLDGPPLGANAIHMLTSCPTCLLGTGLSGRGRPKLK